MAAKVPSVENLEELSIYGQAQAEIDPKNCLLATKAGGRRRKTPQQPGFGGARMWRTLRTRVRSAAGHVGARNFLA